MLSASRVSFPHGGPFFDELQANVRRKIDEAELLRRARSQLNAKAILSMSSLAIGWFTLILFTPGPWESIACLALISLGVVSISLSVQHDANHNAFSKSKIVNRFLGWGLDCFVGLSSHIWRTKHNIAHHSFTNILNFDDDISQAPFAAFSPHAPRRPWYKYQHYYIWPLYGLMAIRWQLTGDALDLLRGRIGHTRVKMPRGMDLLAMVSGKLIYFAWTLLIPMLVYPWWLVVSVYISITAILSLIIALTFQLAHCVEGAKFLPSDQQQPEEFWAEHQIHSTANFATNSKIVTWLLGGLNYQIEHHLFPWLPHTIYPTIAPIVKAKCAKYGIEYRTFPTLGSAISSHFKHVRNMALIDNQ